MQEGTFRKTYLALVCGTPEPHCGIIDAPIARVVRTPTVALMRLLFLVIVMPPYASSTVNRKLVSYWHTRKSPSGVMLVVRILST